MSATPATRVLDAAGVGYRLHPYHHDPASRRFGEEAAEALGVEPERIFKTLLVDAGGQRPDLAVAVVPVAGMLDLKAMAEALGVRKVALADPAVAERSTDPAGRDRATLRHGVRLGRAPRPAGGAGPRRPAPGARRPLRRHRALTGPRHDRAQLQRRRQRLPSG
jgi:hypothetical protein